MNFAARDSVHQAQWAQYRELELIPDSVPRPAAHTNPLKSGINGLWRSLLGLLMDELVEEQRVEYLERCWALNEFGEREHSASSLHRFWVLIE